MVNRAVGRRIPGLELTLMHLANLVRLHPGQLSKRHLDGACVALRYLLEDTRWPSEHERREPSAPRSTIPMDDRPEYRRRCTALAACLAVRYADIGEPAPEILSQWREESGNDTLPEIRRAWRN
jgi:hypothetical protein